MSTTEPQVRYRHVPLPTQQRRLRHLRSIAVRNIVQKGNNATKVELAKTETFFTLHKNAESEALYTSERIEGTLNPTWRGFNLEHVCENQLQRQPISAQTYCVVRIWRGVKDDVKLCIEWTVHFGGLVFLGEKSQRDALHYPSNTVLFGILEGVYSMPISPPPWDPGKVNLEVDVSSVRKSYSTQTLLRIKTVLRAIKQTQASVHRIKSSIEGKLHHSLSREDQRSKGHLQTLKNNLMHSDLEWRASTLRAEREQLESERNENRERERKLKAQFKMLHDERGALHEKKKGYFDTREDLIKTGAMLVARRKVLIAELAFIYPIIEINPNQYSICSVRLPNSEDFSGQDDVMISVALGYTCHLVEMISKFLDVPMRYPMEYLGSRSLIRDHIIDKLAERERDFPLYGKGRERFQFNYGVYLLNKNIAQLRYYCALATTDLRLTLPNLKGLLEFRLGVKFEAANAPVLAGQHMSVPPNLGGPQKSSNPMFGLSRRQSQGSTSSQNDPQASDPSNSPEKTRRRSSSKPEKAEKHSKSDSQSLPESVNANDENSLMEDEKAISLQETKVTSDTMISSQTEEQGGGVKVINCPVSNDDTVSNELVTSRTHSKQRNSFVSSETESETERTKTHDSQKCSMSDDTDGSPSSESNNLNVDYANLSPQKHVDTFINEDLETSSSDENLSLSATYNSRFKMWASDPSVPEGDESSVDSVNGVIPPSTLIPSKKSDSDMNDFPTSTFKTKAMTSPTCPVMPAGRCDDLLAKAESCDIDPPKVVTLPNSAHKAAGAATAVKGPFHRDRTDSDADSEESATFVIPQKVTNKTVNSLAQHR